MGHCADETVGIPRQHGRSVLLQPGKEIGIAQQTVFDHLRITASQVALRQGGQDGDIGDHEARLMKYSDEILAAWRVNGGLAAHRRIHLRQKRRWNLYEINATLEDSGSKSRQVANDTATQRHNKAAAFHIL